MLNQQAAVQKTQQQLSTGQRILTPADDPVGAARIIAITDDLAQLDQFQRNGDLAEGQIAREETTLGDVATLLQRVRELVVQANNASQTPETRSALGTEVQARLDELLALANTKDANGEPIFAGFQVASDAFSKVGTTVTYNGDQGQRFVQVGPTSQVAVQDSGYDVFMAVPTGNGAFTVSASNANTGTAQSGANSVTGVFQPGSYTVTFSQATPADPVTYQVEDATSTVIATGSYTDGDSISFAGATISFTGQPADGDTFAVASAGNESMFSMLQNIVDALDSGTGTPANTAQVQQVLGQSLSGLDQAIGHVGEVRAKVGVRLNQIDSQRDINSSFNLQLEQTLSEIRDLDYAEAISRLNLQMTALEAAQQTYVKVQGLSLFNYL